MNPMASLKPTTANNAHVVPLISERPIGAIHYRIIALCFAAWIFDFYDLILYSFMLLPIARDLHLSQTESSLTLGLALAMTAVGGVIFGFVGDRFGRKPTIIVVRADLRRRHHAMRRLTHSAAVARVPVVHRNRNRRRMGRRTELDRRDRAARIGVRATPPTCRSAHHSVRCLRRRPAAISNR